MQEINTPDEQQIARLIASLPPAPAGWAEAAYEVPATRAELDDILARIERDERFRAAVQADLDLALVDAGVELSDLAVAQLRRRLAG